MAPGRDILWHSTANSLDFSKPRCFTFCLSQEALEHQRTGCDCRRFKAPWFDFIFAMATGDLLSTKVSSDR